MSYQKRTSIVVVQINHRRIRHYARTDRRTPPSDLIYTEINWDQLEIHPKVTQIFSQGLIRRNPCNILKILNKKNPFIENATNFANHICKIGYSIRWKTWCF